MRSSQLSEHAQLACQDGGEGDAWTSCGDAMDVEEEARALPRQYYEGDWDMRIPGGIRNMREHRTHMRGNDSITRARRVRQALQEIEAEIAAESSDETV